MNALRRTLFCSFFYVAACPALYGQALPEEDRAERMLRNHAAFLNELSDRRRLNTFFPNEQSAFYGVQVRYVNSSRGNLTFVRRDLVTIGRIPIVLARVYDSSLQSGSDFGPGWRLSLAETITRRSDGTLSYVDDSASELKLVPQGGGYVPAGAGPTDIASVEASGEAMRITHRSGWIKQFISIDGRFRLTAIRDRYGNAVAIRYSGQKLSRIEGQNGRFVAIERDDTGRVRRATDDQRREVSYAYDRRGQLEIVTDLGGYRWRHQYDALGHLQSVIDPRDVTIVEVTFDSKHRARTVQILGVEYRYDYQKGDTLITDEARRVTRVSHNRYGMATTVTNPNGFTTEVVLDQDNRVSALLHNGTPRATLTYDPSGRIDTLNRLEAGDGVEVARKSDDGMSGVPLRKHESEDPRQYEYTPQGDLRSVTRSGERTVYDHNADGQIEAIQSPRGTTTLRYFPDGKLKSIQYDDGALHEFRYNALGFRERVERSDGTHTAYHYDAAGNLTHADGHQHNAHTSVGAQSYDINDYNQPETILFEGGDTLKVTYDASGNPETITTSDPEVPVLEYLYDHTDRVVAVQDGDAISGSYIYEDTEPDLRIQLDDGTMRVASGLVRHSASIGDLLSIVYTRPYGSLLDAVRFDQATRTFDIPSDASLPERSVVTMNSLARQQLLDVDASGADSRIRFDRPSNVVFLPPEYATINCVAPCTFNGITLKANGQQNTLIVPAGSTVNFRATKVGAGCARVLYTFYQDSLFTASNLTGMLTRTYLVPGTYEMLATGECLGCDLFRSAYVTVIVTSSGTPVPGEPSCSPVVIDQAAINSVFQWPKKEPYERGVTLVCAGIDVITPRNQTTSWTTTQDPCATAIQPAPYWVAAAHSHPFFTTAAQYRAGVGCLRDQNVLTPTQLNQVNILNEEFSVEGDIAAFCARTQPLYMRVPIGDRVKKLQGSALGCTVTTVFP